MMKKRKVKALFCLGCILGAVLSICLLYPDDIWATDGTQKWIFEVDTLPIWLVSPAMGPDGTIYVGFPDRIYNVGPPGTSFVSKHGKLYAINQNGTEKWTFQISADSTPSIGADGAIHVGSDDGKLYAINQDGTQKWAYQTGAPVNSSPAIGPDGTIYVSSRDHHLYAINSDGTRKWAFETGGHIQSSPAIGSDGSIYVGSDDNNIYAIKPDKTLKWSFTTGDSVWSSPAIDSDGTIYVGSNDDNLYAINSDGTLKWKYPVGDDIWSSPAIGPDGTIYVGSRDGNLYAINFDGTLKWSFETGFWITYSSPAVGSDGSIYFGSNDKYLYALNPDGTLKWKYTNGVNFVETSPVIGTDGTVYVKISGSLYAINGSSGGIADSPWPMFSHDPGHTGVSSPPDTSGISVIPSMAAVNVEKIVMLSISGGTRPYDVVSSNDSIASASLSDSTVTVTGISDGRATVTITDGDNDSTDAEISVIEILIPAGNIVCDDLKIGAIINTNELGPIEASWYKGGENTTSRGDKVIWGYFYAEPEHVSWGSENNPEVFVKIWFDVSGRIDVNYFHVSVPNVEVFTGFSPNGTYDEQDLITMDYRRYVRHYYESGQSQFEANFENGECAYVYRLGCRYEPAPSDPEGYPTINDLLIGSIIHTEEKGPIDAIWQIGGTDNTIRGDEVLWGYFYADPSDVDWGSADNPDLFVKIWFDVSGRIDVNYFHVSVPDDNIYDNQHTTYMDNRYIRHEYWR
jgi:outer membrane protein assembly factor BamB